MSNRWNIPSEMENFVRERDKSCIYCGVVFTAFRDCRKTAASWEHIINDATLISEENIALCCLGCNASKGQKTLSAWLETDYCINKNINRSTVAPVVVNYLDSI